MSVSGAGGLFIVLKIIIPQTQFYLKYHPVQKDIGQNKIVGFNYQFK